MLLLLLEFQDHIHMSLSPSHNQLHEGVTPELLQVAAPAGNGQLYWLGVCGKEQYSPLLCGPPMPQKCVYCAKGSAGMGPVKSLQYKVL